MRRFYLLRDLWRFIKREKNYWLIPLILMLLLIGILIIFGQSSALSSFIYPLF